MNVGDIVTQNDHFFQHFKCDVFYLKITRIDNEDIVYLEKNITINKLYDPYISVECNDFHIGFLKVDISRNRKEKLKKLNSIIN